MLRTLITFILRIFKENAAVFQLAEPWHNLATYIRILNIRNWRWWHEDVGHDDDGNADDTLTISSQQALAASDVENSYRPKHRLLDPRS